MEDLTEEQIKNWRDVLCGLLGLYALIMPVSEIHRIRDCYQDMVNDLDKKMETET